MLVTSETRASLRRIPLVREYVARLVISSYRNDQSVLRDPRSSASFGEGLADCIPIDEAQGECFAPGTTDGIKGIEENHWSLNYNRVWRKVTHRGARCALQLKTDHKLTARNRIGGSVLLGDGNG